MAYSLDFRRQVLAVREREQLTIAQVAQRFAVGKASVMRWLKYIERKPSGVRRRKLDMSALEQDLRDYPDAYQYGGCSGYVRFFITTGCYRKSAEAWVEVG